MGLFVFSRLARSLAQICIHAHLLVDRLDHHTTTMLNLVLALSACAVSSAAASAYPANVASAVLNARGLLSAPEQHHALLDRRQEISSASSAASAVASGDPITSSGSTARTLSEIIGAINGTSCTDTCNSFLSDLTICANGTSQLAIASCACSSNTLGDLRSCASCTSSSDGASADVDDYNTFVDSCASAGLATVTGTVEVGASTTQADRTIDSQPSAVSETISGEAAALTSDGAGSSGSGGENGAYSLSTSVWSTVAVAAAASLAGGVAVLL